MALQGAVRDGHKPVVAPAFLPVVPPIVDVGTPQLPSGGAGGGRACVCAQAPSLLRV